MHAAVYRKYGPPEVVQIEEVSEPLAKDTAVLVEVRCTSVTSADSRLRSMRMPSPAFGVLARLALGVFRPRRQILGTELSGVVRAVGRQVTTFQAGDEVVAFLGAQLGAHAELVAVDESAAIVRKPASLTFADAASLPFGGTTALYFLRDLAKLKSGQTLLVIGASGAVGSAAVQIARHLGATVTGVCSTRNVETVRTLGAAEVIDYTQRDFAHGSTRYDVIFDTCGATTFAACRPLLTAGGLFLPAVLTMTEVRQLLWTRLTGGKRLVSGVAPERKADLQTLMDLAVAGRLRPIVDSEYAFTDIAAAHRRVDTGRKVGSVIVSMPGNELRPAPAPHA